MMDVLLNPIQPQSIPKQEQKRLQLAKERQDEMKRFLAQQASNSHPRLVRLLKSREDPQGPITEPSHLPRIGGEPARPQIVLMSQQSQQQPQQQPQRQQTYLPELNQNSNQYQQQQQQQHNQHQQQQMQMPPRDSIYGFPSGGGAYQYPTMQYHPNPYLPPFHYSQYAQKGDGYSDPYAQHYPSSPYFTSPPQPQQQIMPRPPNYPNPYSQQQLQQSYQQQAPQKQKQQYSEYSDNNRSKKEKENNQQRAHPRHRFGKPEMETKEEYAADLERQIAEKNERNNREKNDRRKPEGGFLGMGQTSPAPPPSNQRGAYRYNDDASNDGYESTNSNAQKQSRYLRDLDEQIRIKKEMKQKEMQMYPGANFGQPPPPPQQQNIYMADAYDLKGARKQFPNETAKIWNSTIFPSSPMRSPQILNKYTTLPGISNNSTEDFIRQNLDKLSAFPPSNIPPQEHRGSPQPTSYLRGAINMDSITDWQRDELRLREDAKKRNQKEIQDVLKQQIAQKEFEKQKEKEMQRIEDEKEAKRVEKEQVMLKERYAREKEEAEKKAEQERKEKEKAIAEKKARRQKEEEDIPVPRKAKKVIRLPSPDQSHEVLSSQPFRSDSPPLPAVLKRMKEEGYVEPPSVQASYETISSQQNSTNQGSTETMERQDQTYHEKIRKSSNFSRQSNRSSRSRGGGADEEDNREILAQLQAIQRELQNEDIKVQNQLRSEPSLPSVTQAERIRFEHDLKEIDDDINDEAGFRSRIGKTPNPPSAPPRRELKSSHQFRRYREVHTPKTAPQTPALRPRPPPTRQLETESQILDISRNIQMLSQDFTLEPKEDPFNIDEIEKLNEMRLRKLENNAAQRELRGHDRDVLADFMSNGISEPPNRYHDRSIPTSPSTFQPLPYNYEL